jgi:hypothetical protein
MVQDRWCWLHFHGLAHFFTEIVYSFAFVQALVSIKDVEPNTVLFHGNNLVFRIVACWDRIGFLLNERFKLGIKDKNISFRKVVNKLLEKNNFVTRTEEDIIREVKALFENDSSIREWRNRYMHQYGEHFAKEFDDGITTENFLFSREDQEVLENEMVSLLNQSFPRLKLAMELISGLLV